MTLNKFETLKDHRKQIAEIGEGAIIAFSGTHKAREKALKLSRDIIRNCADSIRATHRGEFSTSRKLINRVSLLATEMVVISEGHPAIRSAGYVEDAQKEYAEAVAFLAFAEGTVLPKPEDVNIGYAAYLNGLSEVIGELRRLILDSLRKDEFTRCDDHMEIMDEIYSLLVSIDFPEGVTRGLRRSTDVARGILERTRGDLTLSIRQQRLEKKLDNLSIDDS